MITHATQITFNDVISVETQMEYDDCLEVIRKQGDDVCHQSRFCQSWKNVIFRMKDGRITDYITRKPDNNCQNITPASYFIEANRGLLNEKK